MIKRVLVVLPELNPEDEHLKEKKMYLGSLLNRILKIFNLEKNDLKAHILYQGDYTKNVTKTQIKKYYPELKQFVATFKPEFILSFGSVASSILLQDSSYAKIVEKPIYSVDLDLFVVPLFEVETYMFDPTLTNRLIKKLQTIESKATKKQLPSNVLVEEDEILAFIEEAKKQPLVCFDVEATGLDMFSSTFKLLSVGLSFNNKAIAFPLNIKVKGMPVINDTSKIENALRELFSQPDTVFVAHNAKFDIKAIEQTLGVRIQLPYIDTLVMHFILNENENHSLDAIISSLGYISHKNIDWNEKQYATGAFNNMEQLIHFLHYNAKDAIAVQKIVDYALDNFDDADKKVFKNMINAEDVLIDIENHGFKIDIEKLKKLQIEYKKKLEELETKINQYPEVKKACKSLQIDSLNLRSTQHISLVFKKGKYPVINTTAKGSVSTNADTLRILAERYNIGFAQDLLDYRMITKLLTSYIDPYLEDETIMNTSYVHPHYNLTETVTGRLSCSKPNLQQIPKNAFKSIFIADSPKEILLNGDYSQMELRVEAMLSKDPNLIRAYKEGLDIHRFTASLVYDKPMDKITDEERSIAKTVNFAILYGATAHRLAKTLNKPVKEMEHFIAKWFKSYSNVSLFNKKILSFAREHGFVQTPFGRKRRLPTINSTHNVTKSRAERQAINFIIQSTASDFTLQTLKKFKDYIIQNNLKTKLVNTVHDSIMASVPLIELPEITTNFKRLAEDYHYEWTQGVSLRFDIEIGKNWKDTVEIENFTDEGLIKACKQALEV